MVQRDAIDLLFVLFFTLGTGFMTWVLWSLCKQSKR
jgi:hypothetical protein